MEKQRPRTETYARNNKEQPLSTTSNKNQNFIQKAK
jgi:hypothetical protein